MKKWHEFYTIKTLAEAVADDMIVKGYHAMSPADQVKVQKVLASPTWGDAWKNTITSNLKAGMTPQQVAAVMLDGIDTYLKTGVTTSSRNSGRISMGDTRRTTGGVAQVNEPRADYQGNNGRNQTLWGQRDARHGDVPPAEIAAKRLNQYHHDVFDGSLATAPSSYKYVWIRGKNKLVYNPNYQG